MGKERIKEILHKQLELLAEYSINSTDIGEYTRAMVIIVETIMKLDQSE